MWREYAESVQKKDGKITFLTFKDKRNGWKSPTAYVKANGEEKSIKDFVKTKVISARVTEVVHELLHQQAEDAGMTLSEFAAQMLMKGRVNVLEILHERERKALICFSALERQEEKLSAEKAEIVKQRVALYEQYADGNMSKEEFIRQRDAYRVQEDEKMEQIQRLRTEKNQAFQPVKRDTDHLQTVISTVEEAGDVMHLSQNVVETFIDRIEVFNDERVKIRFTFEDALNSYEEK